MARYPAFAIVIVCELLLNGSLVYSILVPSARIWPPPGKESWQYRFTWSLATTALLGALVVGILDWDGFVLDDRLCFIIGGMLIALGLAFALWGVRSLGVHRSLGLKGELVRGGDYEHSRNPQYVGDLALLAGLAVVSNSALVMVACRKGRIRPIFMQQ